MNKKPFNFLGHTGVSGQSGSGKSSLAFLKAAYLHKAGQLVLVLDSIDPERWIATDVFEDAETFLETLKNNTDAFFFIDESVETIGRANDPLTRKRNYWLTQRARHQRHHGHIIMQDYTAIEPPVRKNLTNLCLFSCHNDECKSWARIFNDDTLLQASSLPQYQYLEKTRMKPAILKKLPPLETYPQKDKTLKEKILDKIKML